MKTKVQIGFAAFFALVFGTAIYIAFTRLARGAEVFPLILGIPGLALSLIQLSREILASWRRIELQPDDFIDLGATDSIRYEVAFKRAGKILVWLLGFYLVIWIVGFKIAVLAFFLLYLRVEGQARWRITLIVTAIAGYAIFYHFEKMMSIHWPDCLMVKWFDIPWLFG